MRLNPYKVRDLKQEEEKKEKSHHQRTDANVSHIWTLLNTVLGLKNFKSSGKKTHFWINVYLLMS